MPLLQRKWSEAALLKVSLGKKEMHFLPSAPFKHLEAYLIVIFLNYMLKDKWFWMGPHSRAKCFLCSNFGRRRCWRGETFWWCSGVLRQVFTAGMFHYSLAFSRGIQSLTPGWHICIFLLCIYGINIITTVNTRPTDSCERGSNLCKKRGVDGEIIK